MLTGSSMGPGDTCRVDMKLKEVENKSVHVDGVNSVH